MKTAGAVAIVAVLSLIIIISDLTTEEYFPLIRIYGIGAAVGFLASLAASFLMRRPGPGLRAKSLLLTTGALVVGAAVLSTATVSKLLLGAENPDLYMLLLNYAFGYFIVGVSFDAMRIVKSRKHHAGRRGGN
jgi:hypothetical protein